MGDPILTFQERLKKYKLFNKRANYKLSIVKMRHLLIFKSKVVAGVQPYYESDLIFYKLNSTVFRPTLICLIRCDRICE